MFHPKYFHVIAKIAGFMNNSYYCQECNVAYSHRENHRCKFICTACKSTGKCPFVDWLKCDDCHRYFVSASCYENHKKVTTSMVEKDGKRQKIKTNICKRLWRCTKCDKIVFPSNLKGAPHICGQVYCSTCQKYADKDHQCYMQQVKKYTKSKVKGYIFFDFETSQDLQIGMNNLGPITQHQVDCAIAYKVTDNIPEKVIFIGEDALKQFCDWLYSGKNMGYICIAHNASGFDAQFVLGYLHESSVSKPEVICCGLRLMCLKAGDVTILDSMLFLPMSLAAMVKAFGLKEQKKGWFPHLFNKTENFDYVGPMPAEKFLAQTT